MSGSTVSSLLRSESAHYESWQSRVDEWIVSELSHFLPAQLNILPSGSEMARSAFQDIIGAARLQPARKSNFPITITQEMT